MPKPQNRRKPSQQTIIQVLTEAGYRCAVPTCRGILALDLHHIVEVAKDGPNESSNLLALCPTCHALYTRGIIAADAIYTWKATLVSLNNAFDRQAIDNLLFLSRDPLLVITGDALLKFAGLIVSGLVTYETKPNPQYFTVSLTENGRQFVDAWKKGDRLALNMPPESTAA